MKIGGIHVLLDFVDCEENINDEGFLIHMVGQIAYFCKINIIETLSHSFKPQGVSVAALVSESHICVHTWPESKFLSCDIYSRSDEEVKYMQLKKFLEDHLKGQCTMALIKRIKGKIRLINNE